MQRALGLATPVPDTLETQAGRSWHSGATRSGRLREVRVHLAVVRPFWAWWMQWRTLEGGEDIRAGTQHSGIQTRMDACLQWRVSSG